MKKLILFYIFYFMFSGIADAKEWYKKDFYVNGSDHYVIGMSEWSESPQDAKRNAVKDALLNFSTYTNININNEYIESISNGSKITSTEHGIISHTSKVGKIYLERSKSEKKVEKGFFSDDEFYQTTVQLKINRKDYRPYDVEAVTEQATTLLLNQAEKTKNTRDKEKKISDKRFQVFKS